MGLISRELEKAGIPTVTLSSALDITKKVCPPRTVFINYPLGHTAGKPNDVNDQKSILHEALQMLENGKPGEIRVLDHVWNEKNWDVDLPKINE